MTLEILNEWVFPILCVTGALALIAVGIFRDRATQKELDRLYAHEDKVAEAGVYIEIHDGEIAEAKAATTEEITTALCEALGTHIGRWLPEHFSLGDMTELTGNLVSSCAAAELRMQGRGAATLPRTRHEELLRRLESPDFLAALLQLGTEDMNRCAWCDPEKRHCGCESCEPQRERKCVLDWLNERPGGSHG